MAQEKLNHGVEYKRGRGFHKNEPSALKGLFSPRPRKSAPLTEPSDYKFSTVPRLELLEAD